MIMPELGYEIVLCILFISDVFNLGGHGGNRILNVACSVDKI
jgi:hypothetical protein